MNELTAGLPSKSAKMRRLAAAGYERADIARFLGVRYQFVYNVLSAPSPTNVRETATPHTVLAETESPAKEQANQRPSPAPPQWVWARVERGGRIGVPATFLEALSLRDGDQVQLALESDSIRVLTRARALEEVRDKVRQFVPEGVSLVDELIAERRDEAARDLKND